MPERSYETTENRRDIWTLTLDGESAPEPFLDTPFNEHSPTFSPDGRFLAYVSDESGRDEIYVQPYPGLGAKVPMLLTQRGPGPRLVLCGW